MSEDIKYLISLLEYPEESDKADYKSAVRFDEKDDFSAKLVKHILGFANSGGGYIIIGYKEGNSKNPSPDPNLNDDILSSYDPTRLSQHVHSFLFDEDRIDLRLSKIPFKDKEYPIVSIAGFKKRPYFCKRSFKSSLTNEMILEEGVIYVRSNGAKTVKTTNPADWDKIIDKCIALKREDFSINLKELLDSYFNPPKVTKQEEPSRKWIDIERKKAKEDMGKAGFNKGSFEVILDIPHSTLNIDYKSLLSIAEKAECHNTGWPIGVTMTRPEYKPMPITDGIAATIISEYRDGFDYWTIKKNGNFYFIRNLQEDTDARVPEGEKIIYFDTQIWRIAEGILYCSKLCSELQLKNIKVNIFICYGGLKNRTLSLSPSSNRFPFSYNRICSEDHVEIAINEDVDRLTPYFKDIVYNVAKQVFVMFEFFEPGQQIVDSLVDGFLTSRI